MAKKKQYQAPHVYEKKLENVMERLGADNYNFNWSRDSCFVEFYYREELYRFDHSVEEAKEHGIDLVYGSDAFAQVVLSLEDLARMVERGIYDLSTWVAGMKFLPPVVEIPSFFKVLGYTEIPSGREEVRSRYRTLAKQLHPDQGGDPKDFQNLKTAAEQAMKYFE
jgi:hypothetical protein